MIALEGRSFGLQLKGRQLISLCFAGVSFEGSTLRPDNDANKKLYKEEIHARDIVLHQAIRASASAKQLLSVLNSKPTKNGSQRG